MTRTIEISNFDDMIDVRDVIERLEQLEDMISPVMLLETMPAPDDGDGDTDDDAEYRLLRALLESLKGYGGDEQWRGDWYPISLIRDSYFVDAMQELCEEIGDFPDGVPSYYVIDWEATANNLRVDYSSVEFDGVTYWYR